CARDGGAWNIPLDYW
nr:immunoglobulin heavy chain junction region [Macaca mulatta]MOV36242.1 immunoglobulin heavy chain junction region [Macaca mulatta]MOV36289.1 immunoglobulin heavy chain junction region [Macaca mulatta]MOV36296.1 immunoglobulin heavy chain junction region [Macaca mulatta]MOV36389.1 immunoglobulin heavy chain junction region [Macaca mulatta]